MRMLRPYNQLCGHSLSTILAGYTSNRDCPESKEAWGEGGARGMYAAKIVGFLLLGVIIACAAGAASSRGASWLATGTITKVDGTTAYFLSKDNSVFRVDTSRATLLGSDLARVGDRVRVFGCLTGSGKVKAARVRVLGSAGPRTGSSGSGPGKEVRIVVEKEPELVPDQDVSTEPGAAPSPAIPEPPAMTWQGKGLISEIDFVAHQVKIQTSDGQFTINVDGALMVRGTVRTTFGRLNQGDTIWVGGNEICPNVVDGRVIRVLRSATEAQNAVPMMPVSVVGQIQQVDYASRTFKMSTPSTPIVVSVDDNTVIQFQELKKCFSDLRPGVRVNMSGYGNLTSGYAAQHIQIVGG